MRAIALGYHEVLEGPGAAPGNVYTLNRRDFEKHLLSIEERRPSLKTIREFSEWETAVPVFLTFDDGNADAYTCVADALEAHQWRGHFFITTDWIGRPGYLNRVQIRELHDRDHVIGSHSCSHPERMTHISNDELMREWKESCAVLGDITGRSVRVASVPGGYYARKVALAAANANIEVLFTSEPTSATVVVDGCLVLGRYSIQRHTPARVAAAIAAGEAAPRWQQRVLWETKKILKSLGGESYVTLRRQLLSRLTSEPSSPRP